MLRAIREIQPRWIVGENVPGLINWSGGMVFDELQADLEAAFKNSETYRSLNGEGYENFPVVLPACSVNAPHRRDRVWFVAHRKSTRDANGKERTGRVKFDKLFTTNSINGRHNAGRGTGTEADGIQGVSRKEMESRKFNGTITHDATNPNPTGRGQSNKELAGGPSEQPNGPCIQQIDTNPGNIGLQGGELTGGTGKQGAEPADKQSFRSFCSQWEKFPTQPPVCSRNDGLSPKLVGITVSKHRNESIKGYGNAVVPQVVLQIFKAIEQYEKLE